MNGRLFGLNFNQIFTRRDPIPFAFQPLADLHFANRLTDGGDFDVDYFTHENFCGDGGEDDINRGLRRSQSGYRSCVRKSGTMPVIFCLRRGHFGEVPPAVIRLSACLEIVDWIESDKTLTTVPMASSKVIATSVPVLEHRQSGDSDHETELDGSMYFVV